jgi:hypothetical protein
LGLATSFLWLVRLREARFLTISHLEPQVIAAYCHGQLKEEELAAALSHLSICRVCREMVAELVRTEKSVPEDDGNRKQ